MPVLVAVLVRGGLVWATELSGGEGGSIRGLGYVLLAGGRRGCKYIVRAQERLRRRFDGDVAAGGLRRLDVGMGMWGGGLRGRRGSSCVDVEDRDVEA